MVKRLFLLLLAVFAVAMAVPSTRQQIQDNAFTPVTDEIGRRLVPRRLQVMADQLDVRLSRAEGLPGNFEGWLRRDYSGPETDPWGNPWYLLPGRSSYTVGSMGPDGLPRTDDDLTETRSQARGR
jgi:hypothetical protein